MTDQKPMLVYAATYDSVSAAETDLDAIEQLPKDQVIGSFDPPDEITSELQEALKSRGKHRVTSALAAPFTG